MFYTFDISQLPVLKRYYTQTRNTVWQAADEEHILVLILEGNCVFSIENKSFIAQKGDAVYIPANCSYTRSSVEGTMCTMTYVHFDLSMPLKQTETTALLAEIHEVKKELDEQILHDDGKIVYPQTVYMRNHNRGNDFEKLSGYINSIHLISAENELMCYLQSVLSFCMALTYISRKNIELLHIEYEREDLSVLPANLKKAIRYIRKNYSETITLEKLADYCNVSKQQMTRYFNKELGITPIAYVLDYKISKAKHLLFRNPNLSVKQVAYELGFYDTHYFSRLFKRITGETPGEYRERVLNYVPPKKQD